MTVYDLTRALCECEPDDDVYMVDGGDDVPVLSVSKKDNGVLIKPWEDAVRRELRSNR